MMVITFDGLYGKEKYDKIKESCEKLKSMMGPDKPFPPQKLLIKFQKPTKVMVDWDTKKELSEMLVDVFFNPLDTFCYSFDSKKGFPFSRINTDNIESISIKSHIEIEYESSEK